jgi:hypothetical protein
MLGNSSAGVLAYLDKEKLSSLKSLYRPIPFVNNSKILKINIVFTKIG